MTEKDLQIQDLKAENEKLKEELEQLKQPKAAVNTSMERLTYRDEKGLPHSEHIMWDIINKLAEYEDLEEQGLLLKLPCKIGDTIYEIDIAVLDDRETAPIECGVTCIQVFGTDIEVCILVTKGHGEGSTYSFTMDDFGKTVFLTEQEAQAALEKMKGE